eukprot:TRINITY_DN4308_c0_g1_i1.p1 TRINITY_DN4308_c0_g1~~TRINITY_DN4308_c0_g1_i1.p1  ORF type:complete len:180 (+),score=33.57 TRINITY_DN4308_c0_g1_i1:84-623(+)
MGLTEFLEKQGLRKRDVPVALLYVKGMTYVTYLISLGLCYRYRPLFSLSKLKYPQQFLTYLSKRYNNQYTKWQNRINRLLLKSEKISEMKYFKPIPKALHINPKRFTVSMAENVLFYKLTLPITLPLQVYVAIKIISKRGNQTTFEDCLDADQFENDSNNDNNNNNNNNNNNDNNNNDQ